MYMKTEWKENKFKRFYLAHLLFFYSFFPTNLQEAKKGKTYSKEWEIMKNRGIEHVALDWRACWHRTAFGPLPFLFSYESHWTLQNSLRRIILAICLVNSMVICFILTLWFLLQVYFWPDIRFLPFNSRFIFNLIYRVQDLVLILSHSPPGVTIAYSEIHL